MNYIKIYEDLINRGKDRVMTSYKEKHHIIPRCLGGTDDPENLVFLSPEEHYVAHQLLVKIHNGNHALVKAAAMMIPNRPSNKLYGWLRRKFSESQRGHTYQLGEKNSQFDTIWILNRELRQNKKINKLDSIPVGWEKGYAPDFNVFFQKEKEKQEKEIARQSKHQKKLEYLREIMYYYRDNNISMRELSKKFGVGQNVYVSFERYFKYEYHEIVKTKPMNSNITKGRY
jgi:hypothetical protein